MVEASPRARAISKVAAFPKERFVAFCKELTIISKDYGTTKFKFLGTQDYILDEICEGLDRGITVFVILKARQLGCSTFFLALDLFWAMEYAGLLGAFATHTEQSRDQFRNIIKTYFRFLPKRFKLALESENRGMLILENRSLFAYLVAGVKEKATGTLGRSGGYNFLHACVAPGTPVILWNGWVAPIEEVAIGDLVLTHAGETAKVIDVVGQPNAKGPLIRITPWLGQAVSFTGEHTIPTGRGIVEARNVRKDDWLVMPIRPISAAHSMLKLGDSLSRPQHGGSIAAGSGANVILTEELGFFIGYYLAEGCVVRQHTTGAPSAITFARHRGEKAYADRACAAVEGLFTSRKTVDRENCLTSTDTIYGTPLARMVADVFGSGPGKMIPDQVFCYGEAFCRGLLAGVLSGDGSKTLSLARGHEMNRMTLPTTRSSIATQARDLAASLGYGWASLTYQLAREAHGRMCQPQWRVVWCGAAAEKLAKLIGIKTAPRRDDRAQKYRIEDGRVLIKIRSIETGIECDEVWDLSVDHPDHTFRTPSMAIGNTEVAYWGSQDDLNELKATMSTHYPHRLQIYETTANGFNHFSEMWERAKSSPTQKAIFVGWWRHDDYRFGKDHDFFPLYVPDAARPSLTARERRGIQAVRSLYQVEIGVDQIAWYRWKMEDECSGDQAKMDEMFPWVEDDAFVATGAKFFTNDGLTAAMKRARLVQYLPFRYHLTDTWHHTDVRPGTRERHDLKIWEEAHPNGVYSIGCDPAYGSSDTADRTVVAVYRCYADRAIQVAEYVSNSIKTYQCAWVLAHLAGYYRDCMINLEINGPGQSVFDEINNLKREMASWNDDSTPSLKNVLGNFKHYLYRRQDSLAGNLAYQWRNGPNVKPFLMNSFKDSFELSRTIINSMACMEEMKSIVIEGSDIRAEGHKKDDRVMASALAFMAWHQWIKPRLIAQGRSYKRETEDEAKTPNQVMNMIQGYLKTAKIVVDARP